MLAQTSESQTVGLHEEGDGFFQDIELLQSHGINVADIKKLKSAGICTIRGIQMTTKKKMCAIKGLSEAKVDKMKEAILKICGSNAGFCTALQHSLNRRNVFKASDYKSIDLSGAREIQYAIFATYLLMKITRFWI